MQDKKWGNAYRTMLICVDSCTEGVLAGRIYHPLLPGGESFRSLMELLLRMERLLDQMLFPQPFTARRSFSSPPVLPDTGPPAQEGCRGACATFSVRVLFRQNASWQGSVVWMEQNREESFRSVLELLELMSSALPAREEEAASDRDAPKTGSE